MITYMSLVSNFFPIILFLQISGEESEPRGEKRPREDLPSDAISNKILRADIDCAVGDSELIESTTVSDEVITTNESSGRKSSSNISIIADAREVSQPICMHIESVN